MDGLPFFMQFRKKYKCFSVVNLERYDNKEILKGNKIIMPPSALYELSYLSDNFPMVFRLFNRSKSKSTHCGVLEFVAEEGRIYLPEWMMELLEVNNGETIKIRSTRLPSGNFVQFQPLSEDFLDIANPRAVLENTLRNFTCLSTGDTISIFYNNKIYKLLVLKTKPTNAIRIIDCDVSVEFISYHQEQSEPKKNISTDDDDETEFQSGKFVAFQCSGFRLDGKPTKDATKMGSTLSKRACTRGIPDYKYKPGSLRFIRQDLNLGKSK